MSFVSSLYPMLRSVRSIPGAIGTRDYSLSITVRTNDGDYGLEGTPSDVTTVIQEANGKNPKVRFLREDERALGQLPAGSVEVGPITPYSAAGGGLTWAQLTAQDTADKNLVWYTLTGDQAPNGAKYRLVGSESSSTLHNTITLAPSSD